MIRRFLGLMIFSTTVTVAVFGQNYFGRNDIIHMAHHIQQNAPHRVEVAWRETDKMLAELAPEAGQGDGSRLCVNDDMEWHKLVMTIHTSSNHTSL